MCSALLDKPAVAPISKHVLRQLQSLKDTVMVAETTVETTVRQILESKGENVHSIAPDATVLDGLKVLAKARVGVLPVVEKGKLVGIFSERDYARKIILEGRRSEGTRIQEVMTSNVSYVSPDHTIRECMVLMSKNHFRHLPVVESETLVGLVSISDIVQAILVSPTNDPTDRPI